jgi:hypothetical protein
MEIKIGGNTNKRSRLHDSIVTLKIASDSGLVFTAATMPEIELVFYIENRSSENLTASFLSGVKTNCTIDTDGTVDVFIPANTFSVAGKLYVDCKPRTANSNFSDNTFNDFVQADTKIYMTN